VAHVTKSTLEDVMIVAEDVYSASPALFQILLLAVLEHELNI
jgi:hypothetical protein